MAPLGCAIINQTKSPARHGLLKCRRAARSHSDKRPTKGRERERERKISEISKTKNRNRQQQQQKIKHYLSSRKNQIKNAAKYKENRFKEDGGNTGNCIEIILYMCVCVCVSATYVSSDLIGMLPFLFSVGPVGLQRSHRSAIPRSSLINRNRN